MSPDWRNSSEAHLYPPFEPAWEIIFPVEGGAGCCPLYVCSQEKLFVSQMGADTSKFLLAIDPSSGEILWSKGKDHLYHYETIGFDEKFNRLYVASWDTIIAFDPADGNELLRYPVPTLCGFSDFIIYDGDLYITGCDTIVKVDRDGNIIWTYKDWDFLLDYDLPSIGDGLLYVISNIGWMHAFSIQTGELVWETITPGQAYTAPVVGNGMVFIGAQGGGNPPVEVVAYNAYTGQPLWGLGTGFGGTVEGFMSFEENILYFGSNDQYVYAVDTTIPRLVWRYDAGNDVRGHVRVIGDVVYASSTWVSTLHAFEKSTGSLLWSIPDRSNPMPCNGMLITYGTYYSPGIRLQAFKELGQIYLPFIVKEEEN